MEQSFDLIIVGAGIVGLATGLEAVRRHPECRVLVLEKETSVAAHQTGHNSGVIHSGVYYKPGSLKARMCVAGAAAILAFCQEHGLPYEICGKVIVATSERELPRLEEIHRRGVANGVPQLAIIGPERLRELEPHARGIRALHVPGTGIADYVAVARKYAELITAAGGQVLLGTRVVGIDARASEIVVQAEAAEFHSRGLINCAGLHSDRIARLAGASTDTQIVPFRGEYYELAPQSRGMVHGLIYPVPDPALPFLGVHFTRRVGGGVEAGPDAVLAFGREAYRNTDVNLDDLRQMLAFPGFWRMAGKWWRTEVGELHRSFSKSAFTHALQVLMPEISESDLHPGGAGIRAQAVDRQGHLIDDFHYVVEGRGIHVLNVPSPAATASLLIGRSIMEMAEGSLNLPSPVPR